MRRLTGKGATGLATLVSPQNPHKGRRDPRPRRCLLISHVHLLIPNVMHVCMIIIQI